MARIAVDAMGGDRAPEEIVAGSPEAASPQINPVLVGPAGLETGGLELVEAPTTIAMDEKPADAVRGKRDSSLVVACRLVREGRANADGRAEHLRQFALMGSVFAREILGISDPEVRLLSIGEEPEKGNQLTLEAHRLLSEAEDLNFRGNTESRNL